MSTSNLHPRVRTERNGGSADRSSAQRRRVLVVDDDFALVRLLRAILTAADYEVDVAYNGANALEVAAKQAPDVVVLDLRMPVMDGAEFLREFRALGYKAPVLIASSYGAREARLELGAEGSIEKPFDPESLIRAVNRLVGQTQAV